MTDSPSKNRISFAVTAKEQVQLRTSARADDRTIAQYVRKQLGLTALLENADASDS
jgi:hypothetical protein